MLSRTAVLSTVPPKHGSQLDPPDPPGEMHSVPQGRQYALVYWRLPPPRPVLKTVLNLVSTKHFPGGFDHGTLSAYCLFSAAEVVF